MIVFTLTYYSFFLSSNFKDLQDLQHFLTLCSVKNLGFKDYLALSFFHFSLLFFMKDLQDLTAIIFYSL